MKKVFLIEHTLAHYRRDVFQSFLADKELEFEIVTGGNYMGVKNLDNENDHFRYTRLSAFGHSFYYLRGSVGYVLSQKPDAIICTGVDFHLPHTIIIYLIYRIVLGKKFFWWSHATAGNQGRAGYLIRRFFYKTSSGVFSYNRAGKELLLSMGIRKERIIVVNNSINREDYGYLNNYTISNKAGSVFKILYSGRVTKEKKLDVLINALALLKNSNYFDFKCFIIGEGNIDTLKNLSEGLNVNDKIEFVGEKYGKDVHPYFLESNIFVYPGGIGLSIVHALSFGLPVLTSDNIPLHFPEFELLKPGYNGDLFKDNSPEDLFERIISWRKKLYESGEKYSGNCVARIKEMGYLPEMVSSEILSFLKDDLLK